MPIGQAITIWLARLSTASYIIALVLLIRRSPNAARRAWTVAVVMYLMHVAGAFEYFYDWSHRVAYRETARQTAELFGLNWGGGVYLNYAFTAVWLIDCVWWWVNPESYRKRPAAISWSIHIFLGFMFFNATLVVWLLRAWSR